MIYNTLRNLTQVKTFLNLGTVKFMANFISGASSVALISLYVNSCGATTTPYTDPAQFTKLSFGSHSQWLQPWRAYLETVPAKRFLNGTGINWNVDDLTNPELVAAMLAKHGIRQVRIEVGWSNIDFYDETKLIANNGTALEAKLLALKKYGIRPLILLNANHGVPGPVEFFSRTLAADARVGDTRAELNDVSGLKVGYSGLSNLTDYWAAEAMITNLTGNTVTFSKPLPKDIKAGTSVTLATLKYRPFSPPGSADYQVTIAGWQKYVGTVAKFVANALGTTQSSNKGFDMEIWNELTFGSNFLSINNYYAQKPYEYDQDSIWTNLVEETAAYVESHSVDFQGVRLGNGFANTIPWTASSQQPARITAINKHPYAGRRNYPQDEKKSIPLNALGEEDKSGFTPTYSALFPEYHSTAIETETIVRDMGPITSEIYGIKHGRGARTINDVVVPTPMWITEVNINPLEDDRNITAERALALKAKTTARYFCFYLNKGATRVYMYAAAGGDKEFGIVQQNFLNYTAQPNAVYPSDDTAYTSPTLAVLSRIVAKMRQQVELNLKSTRPLQVVSISDTHNHYQFAGDGSAAHPNLYNRDLFAFLPFQVNARKFIVPYYVMTRDVMKDLPPEQFTVKIQGLKSTGISISAYDPLNNKAVPVVVKDKGNNYVSVLLTATDYPYLLTLQETE